MQVVTLLILDSVAIVVSVAAIIFIGISTGDFAFVHKDIITASVAQKVYYKRPFEIKYADATETTVFSINYGRCKPCRIMQFLFAQ